MKVADEKIGNFLNYLRNSLRIGFKVESEQTCKENKECRSASCNEEVCYVQDNY